MNPCEGASDDDAAGASIGAYLAPGGGVRAEVLSTGAGGGEVVAGASVGADGGVVEKEGGIGDGSTGGTDWADGVTTSEESETDGVGTKAGVELGDLLVRVSMLTVLP